MRFPPLTRRTGLIAATLVGLVSFGTAHGIIEKPFYNDLTNYTTRGATPGTQKTKLYMMAPPLFLTGGHDSVGWRVTIQDEEAATQESTSFSFVKFAANGRPDVSAKGTVLTRTYRLFGFGLKGTKAFDWLLTVGIPQQLPVNFGIGLALPANAKWPKDGASVHAQLNVAKDSRRLRVPAPFDKQVFAFEQSGATGTPTALGGRSLDILQIHGLFIEPVMQAYNRSRAYGLGLADLLGPEAMHPSAARGDALGLRIDGGQLGADGYALVLVAPGLTKTPIPFPRGSPFYLEIRPPYPIQLFLTPLDSLGRVKTDPIPFAHFPKSFRSFWLQTVILNPFTFEVELTDAIGIRGV